MGRGLPLGAGDLGGPRPLARAAHRAGARSGGDRLLVGVGGGRRRGAGDRLHQRAGRRAGSGADRAGPGRRRLAALDARPRRPGDRGAGSRAGPGTPARPLRLAARRPLAHGRRRRQHGRPAVGAPVLLDGPAHLAARRCPGGAGARPPRPWGQRLGVPPAVPARRRVVPRGVGLGRGPLPCRVRRGRLRRPALHRPELAGAGGLPLLRHDGVRRRTGTAERLLLAARDRRRRRRVGRRAVGPLAARPGRRPRHGRSAPGRRHAAHGGRRPPPARSR